jgi:hypothetical protein
MAAAPSALQVEAAPRIARAVAVIQVRLQSAAAKMDPLGIAVADVAIAAAIQGTVARVHVNV